MITTLSVRDFKAVPGYKQTVLSYLSLQPLQESTL